MKGKGSGIIALGVFSLFVVLAASPAFAFYFPDPLIGVPTEYDLLYGTIFDPLYTYSSGSEVAGFDAGGNVVFRSIVTSVDDNYVTAAVWDDVSYWRLYDFSTMYVWEAFTTTGTTWPGYSGDWGTYIVNLERFGDEPILIVPEPTTMMALGLLAVSGLGFFRSKKKREE